MFRNTIMAAASAAAMAGFCLTAQAQLVPLEIEGPLTAYQAETPESGFLTVMGQIIYVDADTDFLTPTANKTETQRPNNPNRPLTATQWMRGEQFEGRRRPGFLNGTVIAEGYWDPAMNGGAGGIYAEEVFSDVLENVILGVITENVCTSPGCNEGDDFIRGNGTTVFVDSKDQRMPAQPIVDAGLFELNLTGANLVGSTFGGEGYYSDDPVHPRSAPVENALVYWDFELGEIRPDLLLRPNQREISILRIRCTAGDRLEVRGWVHQPVNAQGVSTAGTAATGTIRTTMRFPAGSGIANVVRTQGTFTPEANPAYARYQQRQDVPNCAEEVQVDWVSNQGVILATVTAPVDRLRDD